jgi:hypothetical protein
MLRQRRGADKAVAVKTVAVRPEPASNAQQAPGSGGYCGPNILTSPSVLQLRTAVSGGGDSTSSGEFRELLSRR